MNQTHFKLSLLAVAVSAALAACGGGGGGETTTTPPPTTGTTTTGTTTSGQTLTAVTGNSSGGANNLTGPARPGLPAIQPVPNANLIPQNPTLPATSAYATQAKAAFDSINDWRDQMRFEEENGGTRLGVGTLAQRTALDSLAASFVTALPNLFSTNATDRAQASESARTQLLAQGYEAGYVLTGLTANTLGVSTGNFCAKTLFSSLPGIELASSGVRDIGLSVPESGAGGCVALLGLSTLATWQLPPTASSSVYPFPGKQLTLSNYYGDSSALGFAAGSTPGHAVFVSLASNDAPPVAIPGVGSGAAIPASEITVQEFNVKLKSSGAVVAARLFSQAGVVGSGVTLTPTSQLLFPTSIMLVPEAPLPGASVYTATFRATVRGRPVTRTWDFTTASTN
jgi:hypothetical protein